jgi:hypothetical protein
MGKASLKRIYTNVLTLAYRTESLRYWLSRDIINTFLQPEKGSICLREEGFVGTL